MNDLSEIASISGKGGLFRVLKPGRSGVILESLDDKKIKLITGPNHKVSILAEISLYTTTEEGSVPLADIFVKINKEFGNDPGIDNKSTPDELMSFIEYIIPEYDTQRVYPSDIKKLINWYHILLREAPDLMKEKPKKEVEEKSSASSKTNEDKNVENQKEGPSAGKKKSSASNRKKPSDKDLKSPASKNK
jgi:hypothetical protein